MNRDLTWSKDMINCYELKADCTRCLLAKILETPCKMDVTVQIALKEIGEPKEENSREETSARHSYNKQVLEGEDDEIF